MLSISTKKKDKKLNLQIHAITPKKSSKMTTWNNTISDHVWLTNRKRSMSNNVKYIAQERSTFGLLLVSRGMMRKKLLWEIKDQKCIFKLNNQ